MPNCLSLFSEWNRLHEKFRMIEGEVTDSVDSHAALVKTGSSQRVCDLALSELKSGQGTRK